MHSDAPREWDARDVEGELDRILAAPEFASSRLMAGFLRFVVSETLAGRSDRIKQYTIATKVFQRDSDFDPQVDPVVRVQAAKVRRALTRFYYEEGREAAVLIAIPKGTYVPCFSRRDGSSPPQADVALRTPTVAVMPFQNQSGDSSQDFLALGFAEDLSTELSRFPSVSVVAYYTTQQQDAGNVDLAQLGKLLNADYLITGTLRQSDPEFRMNVHVIDTETGEQIWAERFREKRDACSLSEIQDGVLRSVVARVAGRYGAISSATVNSSRRIERASLGGYEAVLRGLHYENTLNPADYQAAIEALERAVSEEPSFAAGSARLAILLLDAAAFGIESSEQSLERGIWLAERAAALDPNSQDAHFALAWSRLLQRDTSGVVRSAWKMVDLNPGEAFFVGSAGWFLALAGEREKGLELIDQSKELNPNCPSWFNLIRYLDFYHLEEFDQALHHARSIGLPDMFWDPLLRAAVHGKLRQTKSASEAIDRLIELRPDFASRHDYYLGCFVIDDGLRAAIFDGLRLAGLETKSDPAPQAP